jgi:hypothetical protein
MEPEQLERLERAKKFLEQQERLAKIYREKEEMKNRPLPATDTLKTKCLEKEGKVLIFIFL